MNKSCKWMLIIGIASAITTLGYILIYRIWPGDYLDDVNYIMFHYNYFGIRLAGWLENIVFKRGIGPEGSDILFEEVVFILAIIQGFLIGGIVDLLIKIRGMRRINNR